jgi:uncharacterized protein YkwD
MLRCLLGLLLAAGAVLFLPGVAHARACAGVDRAPKKSALPVVRAGLACLHNRARAAHGLPRLRRSARLTRAARGHSARMVRHDFFGHTAPSGRTARGRVRRTRFAGGRPSCVGENLAWATGSRATARQVFRAWLASPRHRAIVLDRRYRAVGIGVVRGAPGSAARDAATFTVVFAAR